MQFDEEKELTEEVLPEQQEASTENIREEFIDENSEGEPQKKYQNRYQDKYKKIRDEYKEEQNRFQSERNKLLEELEKRNQEIETWKSYANQSINASAFHYHTSAEQRLKAAEERLDMARRDGDFQTEKLAIKEMVDAQTDIREARKIRNDIDSYNSNNNYENQNQQKYTSIPQNQTSTNTQDFYSPEVEYRAAKWVERNPEINPQSQHYNQKTEVAIRKAAEDLTSYFHQQGRPDLVGSVQYFNYLEEYKEKLEENKLQNRMQKENSDYAHFAPVKGTQTQNVEYSKTMSSDLRKKLEAAAEASEMPFDTYLKMYQDSQKDIKTLAQQGK
jgi:hypothetical protein